MTNEELTNYARKAVAASMKNWADYLESLFYYRPLPPDAKANRRSRMKEQPHAH